MYKKVIDILSGNDVNFRDISISIAKSNPSIFIKAYEETTAPEAHHDHDLAPRQTATEYFVARNGSCYYRHFNISSSLYVAMVSRYGFEDWLPGLFGFLFPLNDQVEKINAIKLVRQETGLSLKAAKEFCEKILDNSVPEIKNYNY